MTAINIEERTRLRVASVAFISLHSCFSFTLQKKRKLEKYSNKFAVFDRLIQIICEAKN